MQRRSRVDTTTSRSALAVITVTALMLTACGTGTAGRPVADPNATAAPASSSTPTDPPTSATAETSTPDPTTSESSPTPETSAPSTSETPATAETSKTSENPDPTDEPDEDVVLAFGGSYTWADGLRLTMKAPKPYSPKDEDKDKGDAFVSIDYTLTNTSELAFLYGGSGITKSITSKGKEGRVIVDIDLPPRPEITLVPGQSIRWQEAYGVASADDLTLRYALTGDQEPVSWSTEGSESKGSATGDAAPFEPFVGMQKFGGTYTFASGMTVTASEPKNYTPGEYARGPQAKRYVRYDITVVNGSRETFDPTHLTYGMSEDGTRVGSVTESDQKIDTLPKGRIPPGSKYTLRVAFGVEGTADRVLDIRIRENPPVVFTDIAVPDYTSTEPGAADTPSGTASTGGTSTAPTSDEPPDDQVDAKVAVKGADEVKIDGSITWENGVTVSVSRPTAFTPSNDRRHPQGSKAVKVTVTVTNGSKEPLTSFVFSEASSKNSPALSIIDTQAGLASPDIAVEPGKKTTVDVGWWVLDPDDMVIMVRPDSPYDPGYLSSTGPQKTDAFQPSEGAEGDSDVDLTLGEKFTYSDGLTISVDLADASPVGSVAGDGKKFYAVTATLTNNSDETVRFSWSPRVSSGNASGEQFINENEGIGIIGLRDVLPGRTIVQVAGVSLTDSSDITVATRSPGFYGPSLLWTK